MYNSLEKIENILSNTTKVMTFLDALDIYLRILENNDSCNDNYKPCIFEEYTQEIAYNDFINHLGYIESKINDIEYFDNKDINALKKKYTFENGVIKKHD